MSYSSQLSFFWTYFLVDDIITQNTNSIFEVCVSAHAVSVPVAGDNLQHRSRSGTLDTGAGAPTHTREHLAHRVEGSSLWSGLGI